MKKLIIILCVWFAVPQFQVRAQEQQVVPYTLADRDRAIRTEIRLDALEAKMDARFIALEAKMDARFIAMDSKIDTKIDSVNARIDYIFWLLGFIVALILFMFGYVIWDRRTALRPALEKAEAADIRSSNNTRVLRDYAKGHPDLENWLKIHGLL